MGNICHTGCCPLRRDLGKGPGCHTDASVQRDRMRKKKAQHQKTLHKNVTIRKPVFPIEGCVFLKIWTKTETSTSSLNRWFSLYVNSKCYFSCIDWNKADSV